jgi:Ca2+-binding RTX toxin-like protein
VDFAWEAMKHAGVADTSESGWQGNLLPWFNRWDVERRMRPDQNTGPTRTKAISEWLANAADPLVKTIKYVPYVDPLIVDLDGDGLEITSLNGADSVKFDTSGDGLKTSTAWAGADDGFVVLDRNGNGSIDSGAEMFGDETVLANGQKAANGFAALSELDSNHDGVFSAADAQFGVVRIWRDLNQDGISQADELKTLTDSGVASINLASTASTAKYPDAQLVRDGSYTSTNGSTGQAGSFLLGQNNFFTEYAPIEVSAEAVLLPDLDGSGKVRDLREAATLSPELVDLLHAAENATTRGGFKDAVADLMLAWGNDSPYQSASKQALAEGYGLILSEPQDAQETSWMGMAVKANEADRDAYRATLSSADLAKFDAMRERMVGDLVRIAAYEAFTGFTFASWQTIKQDALNPGVRVSVTNGRAVEVWVPLSQVIAGNRIAVPANEQGYIRVTIPAPLVGEPHITGLWTRLVDDATDNLLPTLRLAKYLDTVNLNITEQGMEFDFGAMDAMVAEVGAASRREGAALVLDLERLFGSSLDALGWTGAGQVRALLQQSASDADVRHAFGDVGYALPAASTTTGTAGADAYMGDSTSNTFNAGNANDLVDGGGGSDRLAGGFGDDLVFGGDGDDSLVGSDGNDTLEGGAGNDLLIGGDETSGTWNGTNTYSGHGNDTYRFGRGDGQDTIWDVDSTVGNIDTIVVKEGIAPSDVRISRLASGSVHLLLSVAGSTDTLTVGNFFVGDGGSSIEQITFADGTIWDLAAIKARALVGGTGADDIIGYASDDQISGADGNDRLWARAGSDSVLGGTGNDTAWGEAGNDSLNGGDGGDTLFGGVGNDTLEGGTGNDLLIGGDETGGAWNGTNTYSGHGNDTYRFGRGDGQDTLWDVDSTVGNIDTIVLKEGIAPSDVRISRLASGSVHLLLSITGSTDTLTVGNFFVGDGGSSIEQITFADGTIWDLAAIKARALVGGAGADDIIAYAGDDHISGADGNDRLWARAGSDTVLAGAGNDTAWGEEGNDSLNGGDGGDTLFGGVGNDTLEGGAGNDLLIGGGETGGVWNGTNNYGGQGNDTYRFGRGDGQDTLWDVDSTTGNIDTIALKEGIAPSDVRISRLATGSVHMLLSIAGSTDTLTVGNFFVGDGGSSIEQISFADGTVWDLAAIKARALVGGPGADDIIGYASSDQISGGDGNDRVWARAGNDSVVGGAGNDQLMGEGGNDTLEGGTGNDLLIGGDETSGAWNGTNYYSGQGNDTYRFGRGDGQDTIWDVDSTAGNIDTIALKEGIAPSDVRISRMATGSVHLLLSIAGSTDTLAVGNFFVGDGGSSIEQISFADGTIWDLATIKARALLPTAVADDIGGYGGDDQINGADGNDRLWGRTGNDTLLGGAGSDQIWGEAGDDIIEGGAGNDLLVGGNDNGGSWNGSNYYAGQGDDTYRFGRGDGQDTVWDVDGTAGNQDVLSFLSGISADQLWFRQVGSALEVSIIGTNDRVQVANWFAGANYHVEKFQTAQGQTLLDSSVQNLVNAMAAFAPPAIGQTTLPANYQSTLLPTITSNWVGG